MAWARFGNVTFSDIIQWYVKDESTTITRKTGRANLVAFPVSIPHPDVRGIREKIQSACTRHLDELH